MRNAWRILSLRSLPRIASRGPGVSPPNLPVKVPEPKNPPFLPPFVGRIRSPSNLAIRWFSPKPAGSDEIKAELESLDLSFDRETMDLVLRGLKRVHSASEDGRVRLNSESYNRMLQTLGNNGRSEEFWRVVATMRKKGFGISKATYLSVSKSFREEKMEKDVDSLNEAYSLSSGRNEAETACRDVRKILREEEPGEILRKKLYDIDDSLLSDLGAALESTSQHPEKALLLMEQVEKRPSLKIDGGVYNVMARILGRKDCINEFQDLLRKMRDQGHELELKTYIKVSHGFHQREKIAAAADLYEFAMSGMVKPPPQDFLFLLKKIVASKDLDLDLITRVVRTFVDDGNFIKRSVFGGVLKSLRSVGRLGECDKVLKAMEQGGFAADSSVHDRVVIELFDAGRSDGAFKYLDNIENEGYSLDVKTWTYLVKKHLEAGELEQALSCFKVMAERRGGENVGCAFDELMKGYCQKDKIKHAHKVLNEMVTKRNVKPWHSTYRFLIEMFINQGYLKESFSLLELMKSHGFPPYIDPYIRYMSESGTVDDAVGFLKAMTVKEFPSRTVFIRVFETLLKAGRHDVAHDILSKSPGSIRNHADVLDLFYSMKPDKASAAIA
ncbi:PPR repeat [Musa troglodytarum]|uniref:PPR repeat n=1 Tax=Musa troglodytarum TaxID=320322 RepID=A0A9E7HTY9_9LILI|nr:PPR repeat [Musa troglodytarum]